MPEHSESDQSIPTWVNGHPAEAVSVTDRGLAYGDGVFETVRVSAAEPVLLALHLSRLQTGLQRLQIPHDWPALEAEIRAYPGWAKPGVVKLVVTRGQGGRGYATANVIGPTRVFSHHPAPTYPAEYRAHGIAVYACQTRLSCNPSLAGIKHLNRLEQVMARQEWDGSEYQEGVLCDLQGNVIEGVFSNLFWVREGRVYTPDLDQSGVAGTMRNWLLTRFAEAGRPVNVVSVTLPELQLADEWFFCNSVYGVWPVRQWNQRTWPVGDTTRLALQWIEDRWQL